jgi:hypothetical protein
MGRRDRTVAVNEVRHSAGGAGWPAALTPAPQEGGNIQKSCRPCSPIFNSNFMRARALFFRNSKAPI